MNECEYFSLRCHMTLFCVIQCLCHSIQLKKQIFYILYITVAPLSYESSSFRKVWFDLIGQLPQACGGNVWD